MKQIPIWRHFTVLAVFLILQAQSDHVCANEGMKTASEIMESLLVGYEKDKDSKPKYTSKTNMTVESLDSDGKVEETENLVFNTIFIEDEEYWRLVKKNGNPLTEDEKEEELEREAKFRKRLKERKEGKEKEDGEGMTLAFDRETVGRFTFILVGTETINGRPTYHLTFKPDTAKKLVEKKDADRFLNACAGDLYIDVADNELSAVKMRLTKTVRFGLGLLAYFKKAQLKFEQKKQPSGEWLPSAARVYIWGRTLLLKPIRQRQKLRFFGYKKLVGK